MIEKNTVLIVGAGASVDYGLPPGPRLIKNILENVSNDTKDTYYQFLDAGFRKAEINNFKDKVLESPDKTIDRIIAEDRQGFAKIGKFAIAQVLLPLDRRINFNVSIQNDWIEYLYNKLTSNFESFEKNNLSIITFNYDKIVENYLYHLFTTNFQDTPEYSLAQKIEIIKPIHLYGQLYVCDWEIKGWPRTVPRDFYDHDDFLLSTQWIRTIYETQYLDDEREDTNEHFREAHKRIKSAEKIAFIGFGFDEFNLYKLKLKKFASTENIKGTAFHMSKEAKQDVEVNSEGIIKAENLIDCDIKTFFEQYFELE